VVAIFGAAASTIPMIGPFAGILIKLAFSVFFKKKETPEGEKNLA
jgi:hypothetical protein